MIPDLVVAKVGRLGSVTGAADGQVLESDGGSSRIPLAATLLRRSPPAVDTEALLDF